MLTPESGASAQPALVYVVDDDEALRSSLTWLFSSVGIESETFSSVADFLDAFDPSVPACLVVDVRMPVLGGFDLQERLNALECPMPVIFCSAHGDVQMSVRALKNGAVDFLEKPYDAQRMIETVQAAMRLAGERFVQVSQRRRVAKRVNELTNREREVLSLLIEGLTSQQIASRLGARVKTIDVHRARIRQKTDSESLTALIRDVLVNSVDVGPASPT